MADQRVSLLLGPEAGEKQQYLKQLISNLKKQLGEDPEIHRFYPFDTDMSRVVSIMKNGSLFSAHKFVMINNVEEIKQTEAKTLAEYCRNPSENVTLVLISDQVSSSQLSSHITKAVKKDQTRIFWELFEDKKHSWILSYFRQRNIRIEDEATDLLLDLVDNNTKDLRITCESLVSYYGEDSILGTKEIETFVYHSKEENVFTLFHKTVLCDLSGALDILAKLLMAGDTNPVGIISGMGFQFKRLLVLSRLTDQNYNPGEALREAQIRGKRNGEIYLKANRNFTTEQLEKIMSLTADCDTALRSGGSQVHRVLLDTYLYSVIQKRGTPLTADIA